MKADRGDDSIIATAVNGAAHVICTSNRHFYNAEVEQYLGQWSIEVADDLELLTALRSESGG